MDKSSFLSRRFSQLSNASLAGGDSGTSLSLLPLPFIKIILGLPRTAATGNDMSSEIRIPEA